MPLEIIDEIRPRTQERATLREIVLKVYGWIGVACLLFLVALAATWPTQANAAGKAQSAEECALFADYGLTNRALILSAIDLKTRLEILGQMYEFKDERMNELATIVRKAADKNDMKAADFAGLVHMVCLKTTGDLSVLLGPDA